MLESFDFLEEEMLHKNVEIFAVGKIVEFATFTGEERLKSPDHFCLIRAIASYEWKRIDILE